MHLPAPTFCKHLRQGPVPLAPLNSVPCPDPAHRPRTRSHNPNPDTGVGCTALAFAMPTGEYPIEVWLAFYPLWPKANPNWESAIQRVLIGSTTSCVAATIAGLFFSCTVFILLLQGQKASHAKKSFEIKHFYAFVAKKILLPDRAVPVRQRPPTLLLAKMVIDFWSPNKLVVLPSMAKMLAFGTCCALLCLHCNWFFYKKIGALFLPFRGSPHHDFFLELVANSQNPFARQSKQIGLPHRGRATSYSGD